MKTVPTPTGAGGSTPHLRAEALVKSYGGRRVVDGVSFEVAPGRGGGPARPERRRQDHLLQHGGGARGPGRRPGVARRARPHPPAHAPRGRGSASATCRRRRRSSASSPCARTSPAILEARGVPRRERNQRADELIAEYRLEKVAGSPGRDALGRRAAPGRGGAQPALQSRATSSSTSRSPASTPSPSASCSGSSPACATAASACWSPTTTCARPWASAAGPTSWPRARILEAGTPAEIAASAARAPSTWATSSAWTSRTRPPSSRGWSTDEPGAETAPEDDPAAGDDAPAAAGHQAPAALADGAGGPGPHRDDREPAPRRGGRERRGAASPRAPARPRRPTIAAKPEHKEAEKERGGEGRGGRQRDRLGPVPRPLPAPGPHRALEPRPDRRGAARLRGHPHPQGQT